MIAIIDYGMGNLRSVQKAFEFLGYDARITDDKNTLRDASHLVLPGVGAISAALDRIEKKGLDDEIRKQVKTGKPFLGICLGMQLLFNKSYENGEYDCLSLIKGEVVPFSFEDKSLKVPHMGWNKLNAENNPLFAATDKDIYVYFVHSYHAANVEKENVIATCDYGYEFCCAVAKDNVFGMQFHPEKSGETGLAMLKKFGGLV